MLHNLGVAVVDGRDRSVGTCARVGGLSRARRELHQEGTGSKTRKNGYIVYGCFFALPFPSVSAHSDFAASARTGAGGSSRCICARRAGAGGGGSEEEAPEALQLRAQLIRLRRARALRLPPTCFLLESLRRRIGHGQCEEQEVCKEVRGPCRGDRVPLGDESGG